MSRKILIVDDKAANLSLLEAILVPRGFEVNSASSGEQALQLAIDFQPDALLLDVMMPEMDGYEVCRRLRKLKHKSYVPVIFVTASEFGEEDMLKGFEAGGDDYVCKPLDVPVLLARVEACLRVKSLHENLTQIKAELSHYVSSSTMQMVESRVAGHAESGNRRTDVTVLFSDIRQFTHRTEQLDPEIVFEILNVTLGYQIEIIEKHGGVIDKLNGDEVMAVFEGDEMADCAIACASDIIRQFPEVQRRCEFDLPSVGIGINSGPVFRGSLGRGTFSDYTVIGATVNIAARLCGQATLSQVLVSDMTRQAIAGNSPTMQSVGFRDLKGLSEPLELFELVLGDCH